MWPDWTIFDRFWWQNFSPNILKLFGPFKKCHYLNIIWCGYFWGNFWGKFGYFLFLHLVTLLILDSKGNRTTLVRLSCDSVTSSSTVNCVMMRKVFIEGNLWPLRFYDVISQQKLLKVANYCELWIWVLWCRKRLLYQLSYIHWPRLFKVWITKCSVYFLKLDNFGLCFFFTIFIYLNTCHFH